MSDPYAVVAERLTKGGFREVEAGCFTSPISPRVVALAVCGPEPDTWRQKAEDLLRKETMRQALSWARYVIVLVDGRKTASLARSAAAFAQDVSKCRRIALFLNHNTGEQVTLPFIGLPSFEHRADASPQDVEGVVRHHLSKDLAEAFLNEEIPMTRVQHLAEEDEQE
jgi:hypothetical protein